MLQTNGIKDVTTTVANPQGNATVKRMHQTIGNVIRAYLATRMDIDDPAAAPFIVDRAFAVARHAIRCAIHRTLGQSPGGIVFNRDMLLPIPLIADLQALRDTRQHRVDTNTMQANLRRLYKDYEVGDRILIMDKSTLRPRLGPMTTGPFTITEIHVNGTITIQRGPNLFERINVRRIKPFQSELV